MADVFDKKKRSEIMSKIRSKETEAEKIVFRYLRREGVYFQKHYKKAPGSPDVALPRKKIAVFIDGDFWHGRKLDQTIDRLPKKYWREKILRNVERDNQNLALLDEGGWKVLRVWESDIKRKSTRQEQLELIKNFLTGN